MIDIVKTCPLGHTCEKAVDGKLERCMWYMQIQGTNPQTGEAIDKFDCAMVWQPILMMESAKETLGVAQSVHSLRNETIKRQDAALALASGGSRAEKVIANN